MANRTSQLYRRAFEKVETLLPNDCIIRYITTDFELAAIQSIASIELFAQAIIKACYFHLQQSLWRKIQEIGAATLYTSNPQFAISCRMLAAIAFVPVEKVNQEFENVVSQTTAHLEHFAVLAQYFQNTYILV